MVSRVVVLWMILSTVWLTGQSVAASERVSNPYPDATPFNLEETSELKLVSTGIIRVYQKFISSQDLPVCNFTPTCSQFGMRVIQDAGMIRGVLLTADRLIRDNGYLLDLYYPRDPSTGRFSDPVERYVRRSSAPPAGRTGPRISDAPTVQPAMDRGSGADYYASENLRRFADHLYAEGDYLRAAGEYQRYLFLQPDASVSVRIQAARSYYLGGQPDQAIRLLETSIHTAAADDVRAELQYALAETYFLLGECETSLALLAEPPFSESYRNRLLMGVNYLKQKRWSAAYGLFTELAETSPTPAQREQAMRYRKYASDGLHLPRKRPWIAGGLSALIPGSGRLYLGRPGDALMTLFVLALTGWQAYDGFSEGGRTSVKGWIYGGLATTFYLGNVYGSVIGARLQNRDAEAALLFDLPLPE